MRKRKNKNMKPLIRITGMMKNSRLHVVPTNFPTDYHTGIHFGPFPSELYAQFITPAGEKVMEITGLLVCDLLEQISKKNYKVDDFSYFLIRVGKFGYSHKMLIGKILSK